jgi:hypothetical protein
MDCEAGLLDPSHLYARSEVLQKPSPVPDVPASMRVLRSSPPRVPTEGTHKRRGHFLLYVGIAPRKPPAGGQASRRTLKDRLRQHYSLNAYGSTLRLTLGCLLGLPLRRIESREHPGEARRLTFGPQEDRLSAWMEEHARVVWAACDEPREVEERFIEQLKLPLNLQGNASHFFVPVLKKIRRECRAQALTLPALPPGS